MPDFASTVDAIVPPGACTVSDAPSNLVTTNRFVASVSGCTDMTDSQGATLSYGYGSEGAQQLWMGAVEHADYLVTNILFATWYIPPDPTLTSYVATHFRLIQAGGLLFYVRNGFPVGYAGGGGK